MNQHAKNDAYMQAMVAAMRHHKAGHLSAAKQAYTNVAKEFSNPPDVLMLIAQVSAQLQDYDAAFNALITLLRKDGNHNAALTLTYNICKQLGDKQQVVMLLHALPECNGIKRVASRLYLHWEEYAKQLALLEKLYQSAEHTEAFYDEYVRCLKNNKRPDKFLAVADEALATFPSSFPLLKLRANAHFWLGNYQDALADGELILTKTPADHYVRTTVGSVKLMLSGCREGFEDYAAHSKYEMERLGFSMAPDFPEWKGENLAGKKLLIWVSQGIGDVVMFAGFLPWILRQNTSVTLAAQDKSVALFARSFPEVKVIPFDKALLAQKAEYDVHSSIGELMRYALPEYTPAEHSPYLTPNKQVMASLRDSYKMRANGKKLVGISWHTINPDAFTQRNISLIDWKPLFELPHIQLVSLQYGDHAQAIELINQQYPNAIILDKSIDAFADIDASATQIAAMDEVVSIDNSTVHLAGAMGIKTTLLLSSASEWRWGMSGTDNRWYKSVYVERQQKLYNWSESMMNVRSRMAIL